LNPRRIIRVKLFRGQDKESGEETGAGDTSEGNCAD